MSLESLDYYEILELPEDATERDVKRAFYRLLPQYAPEQKPKEYQRLREAYDRLSNPVSRREYDSMRQFGEEIERLRKQAEEIMAEDDPDYDEAIRLLKKASVLGPEIGLIRHMLGRCFEEVGDYSSALTQYSRAVRIDRKNLTYRLSRADVLVEMDENTKAEAEFRQVWAIDPEDYRAPRSLAHLLFNTERLDEAIDVLDQAIMADGQVDFQDFFCYYDKLSYELRGGRHDQMSETLDAIVEIARNDSEMQYASFMLARAGFQLYQAKAFDLSARFLKTAKELDPDNEALHEIESSASNLGSLDADVRAILAWDEIHEFVKHLVAVSAGSQLGHGEDEDLEAIWEQAVSILPSLMECDPESWHVRRSIALIQRNYPNVIDLQPGFYRSILNLPLAPNVRLPCPYCSQPITIPRDSHPILGRSMTTTMSEDLRFEMAKARDPVAVALMDRRSFSTGTGVPIHGTCPHCHQGIEYAHGGRIERYTPPSYPTSSPSSRGCYVATEVYGDANHEDVRKLRQYRDSKLMTTFHGRASVRAYYVVGPWLAHALPRQTRRGRLVRRTIEFFVRSLD